MLRVARKKTTWPNHCIGDLGALRFKNKTDLLDKIKTDLLDSGITNSMGALRLKNKTDLLDSGITHGIASTKPI